MHFNWISLQAVHFSTISVCPEYTAELMLNLFFRVADFILQNEGYGKPVSKESTQCKKKNACFNFDTGKNVNTSAPTKLNYFPNQSFKNHKI